MARTNRINPFMVIGILCACAMFLLIFMVDKNDFYKISSFSKFTIFFVIFIAVAILDGIFKEKTKKKQVLRIISLPIALFSCIGLSVIVYKANNDILAKNPATWWGLFFMLPLFAYYFAYSTITKTAPARGIELSQTKSPAGYWLLTSLYGGVSLFILLFLILKVHDR